MRTSSKIATGLAAATIGTLGIVGVANAVTDAPADDTVQSTTDTSRGEEMGGGMGPGDGQGAGPGVGEGRGGHGMGGHHGGPGMGGEMAANLAETLGVDETAVQDALDAIREDPRPADGTGPGEPGAMHDEMTQALADELGVDVADVEAAFDEMQSARQSERRAELESLLSDAVDAGTITQADADAVLRVHDAGVLGGPRT